MNNESFMKCVVIAILSTVVAMNSGCTSAEGARNGNAAGPAPELQLLMPKDGERVENPVAIMFEIDGDIGQLTMSAKKIGTHLHIGVDEKSMMPVRDQIFSVGGNRYVFVLDMPLSAGKHELSVYWAGGDHRTIASSIRKAVINVMEP